MKKIVLILLYFISINLFSQVNFNGGFEDSPAGTGWTIINGSATNKWFVGTNQKRSGTYGAYIGTASTNNTYNNTASSTVHIYKEITFPPCTGDATLSFYIKVNGEKVGSVLYDWLVARLTPTTITMAASTTNQTSGQVANCSIYNPSYVVSQTACNHGNENAGMYFQRTTWSLVTITVPQSLTGYTAGSGSVRRLWFTWSNDNETGSGVGAAIDDIKITTACDLILPTDLTNFNAIKEKEFIILNWQTNSEVNNDYFVIEKSTDGLNFESIDIVKGAGTTNRKINYQSTDKNLSSGIIYYRLKQVDFDGKSTYSKTISIEGVDKEYNVGNPLPNPTSAELSIEFNVKTNSDFIVELIDVTGKKVKTFTALIETGFSSKNFNIVDLESGLYFLHIKSTDGKYFSNHKIIKH